MALDFDSVLADVGDFGPYQYVMYFLICIPASVPSAWNAFNQVFVAAVPDHWCRVPEVNGSSVDERKNYSIPLDGDDRFSQCYQYDLNYSASAGYDDDRYSHIVPCKHGWEFDRTTYDSTIVTEVRSL